MDEHDWLAQRFEAHRAHLRAVAYRMLGSLSEAEDAVQETWLRLSRSDTGNVENLGGWLTTVVGRVCLDMLRSRSSRREEPLGESPGARVPDPIAGSGDGGDDPEQEAILADSVGLALLVVLETLSPAERLAFVLHDMFAMPFNEIAPIVDRSEAATRQLASRARRRVRPLHLATASPEAVRTLWAVRITTGRSMGRKSGRRSRAPIQEGVELLEYELYQKLLEEFMTSRPHRTVMARHDRELQRRSEMSLSEFRMSQRQQNKEDWIAYYQQRIAQAHGLVAYYQERLDYVKGLKPDGDPPRRGSIVTHSQLGMGDDRVSLGDLPEPSRNGHVQKQSNKEVSA